MPRLLVRRVALDERRAAVRIEQAAAFGEQHLGEQHLGEQHLVSSIW